MFNFAFLKVWLLENLNYLSGMHCIFYWTVPIQRDTKPETSIPLHVNCTSVKQTNK